MKKKISVKEAWEKGCCVKTLCIRCHENNNSDYNPFYCDECLDELELKCKVKQK